jgi:hypothetical protein
VPHGRITATFYIVIAIAAALIIMVAVTRVALPRAWVLLAFGVLASATGDAIWFVFEFRGIEPFPSVADAFYLAYPLSGLLLLLLLARLVFDHGARMPVHLIVLVGVGLRLVADVVFGIGTLDGWYAGGGAIASLIAPLFVLIYGERDPTTVRVAAAGAVVLGLLVLLRMAGLTASIGGTGHRPRPCLEHRRPDGGSEPSAARSAPRDGALALRPQRHAALLRHPRSRPLRAVQRHLRPPGGRHAVARGRGTVAP